MAEEEKSYICPKHNKNLLYNVTNDPESLIKGEVKCYYCDYTYKLKSVEEYKIVLEYLNFTSDCRGKIEDLEARIKGLEDVLALLLKEDNNND